jgi:S1-C subfamily serine protease
MRIVRNGAERAVNITVDELDYNAENQSPKKEREVAPPDDHETTRGFGIDYETLTPTLATRVGLKDARGAIVRDVDADGPAATLLQRGDVIVQVGAATITSAADASRELGRVPTGGTVILRYLREGHRRSVPLVKE